MSSAPTPRRTCIGAGSRAPPAQGVDYRNATDALHGMAIAGPGSRELLQRLTSRRRFGRGVQLPRFPPARVGGVPALVARISFTGELGYEIYCAPQYQLASSRPSSARAPSWACVSLAAAR